MYKILEYCPLFRGLQAEEIEQLFQRIQYQVKKYRVDELIAVSGEKIESQMIVIEGSVKGEMMDFTGKTIKIEDIHSPRPLAPAFLFGKNNKYPVNITANEKVTLLIIPRLSFVKMMQYNEEVLNNFLSIISNRAQFLSNKIKFLSFQSIKGKLAHYLLQQLEHKVSDVVVLDKSQVQLAELFGVARPSLGRAIKELDREGVIVSRAKEVRIVDRARLSAYMK